MSELLKSYNRLYIEYIYHQPIVVGIVFLVSVCGYYIISHNERKSRKRVLVDAILAVGGTIFGLLIFKYLLEWPRVITSLIGPTRTLIAARPELQILAILICLLFAFILHFIKRRAQFIYGLTEVGGGIATCGVALSPSLSQDQGVVAALALGGGIYLIVDGYSSIQEWYSKSVDGKGGWHFKGKKVRRQVSKQDGLGADQSDLAKGYDKYWRSTEDQSAKRSNMVSTQRPIPPQEEETKNTPRNLPDKSNLKNQVE